MHLDYYLALVRQAESTLDSAYRQVADAHADEADIAHLCPRLAAQCAARAEPLRQRADVTPPLVFNGTHEGALGLVLDLHELYLLATHAELAWTAIVQAAQAARDSDLLDLARHCQTEVQAQLKWLRTRIKQAAPQTLVVAG